MAAGMTRQQKSLVSDYRAMPHDEAENPEFPDELFGAPSSSEASEASQSRLRWREFGMVYMAYMGYLMCRKNYGFWLPSVLSELGKGKAEAGLLGSAIEVSYGACSLLNGVLIDTQSPKRLLVAGLLGSALINVGVSASGSLPPMVVLWALNGAVQSLGWPSVTNVFLAWFPDPAARGAWYSLLSTCQNAGAALVPLLVSASVSVWGWKAALYAPAAAGTFICGLLALLLYGSPSAAKAKRGGYKPAPPPARPANLGSTIREQVLLNRSLWLMAVTYFGISMVRTCLSDWSSVYLQEGKGLPLNTAARCLFLMEVGGFGGSLVAGALSDKLFAGRRGPVVCSCCALLAPILLTLASATEGWQIQLCYALLGLCAFPVHVLLGLFSREVVPQGVSSSAGGFVKAIAQVGGAFAGYPLGAMQSYFGWEGVMLTLALASGVASAAALPLWRTTAQGRISGRNGTVADFQAMQRTDSRKKMD